jgi:hypothetical protein
MHALRMITGLLVMAFIVTATSIPVQDMSSGTFSVEYNATLRGQYIPDQFFSDREIASYENIQMLYLNYSPVQYISLSVGAGAEQFSAMSYSNMDFHGQFGFSPGGKIALYSPDFINRLFRVTGGTDALYIHSQNSDKTVYSAITAAPYLGVICSASETFDVTAGVRGNLISAKIENPSAGLTCNFSNTNKVQGYCSILLHSLDEGVYFSLDVGASPKVSNKWIGAPLEASVGASIGVAITKPEHHHTDDADTTLFPAYKDMQKKQEEMNKILNK